MRKSIITPATFDLFAVTNYLYAHSNARQSRYTNSRNIKRKSIFTKRKQQNEWRKVYRNILFLKQFVLCNVQIIFGSDALVTLQQ